MPDAAIVMPRHPNLEPDVLALGREMLPPGFRLDVVERETLPAALAGADYLLGSIGHLSDETLLGARRLKLVQLMSVGYDTTQKGVAAAHHHLSGVSAEPPKQLHLRCNADPECCLNIDIHAPRE